MRGKKGLLGYIGSLGSVADHPKTEWFDVSPMLMPSHGVMPDHSQETKRFWWAYVLLCLLAVAFVFRLSQLQIAHGDQNRLLADGNRVRRQVSIAPRGSIVDAKGRELVTNVAGYSLAVVPADLPARAKDRQAAIDKIAELKGLNAEDLTKKIRQAGFTSHQEVTIIPTITREEALVDKIRFAQLPGVHISYVPSRKYDTTVGLAHILGYTSRMNDRDIERHPDYYTAAPIGRAGLESSYDVQLRGQEGVDDIEVNAQGQFQRTLDHQAPKVGQILHLSLDSGLQNEMHAALQEAMEKEKVKQAVGVAMNPTTGAILASVSLPNYDNNMFAQGVSTTDFKKVNEDPDKPLLNRAVDGLYPAGSTIKPFVAAAALQEGTITPQTSLDTSAGVIEIGEARFPDWKKHGISNVTLAIAESNNFFFYALGGGYKHIPPLGVERLGKYYTGFGFGAPTGVDYASDSDGLVPTPEWKKRVKKESWYIGDTYHISIGQGDLLVTPTQLARGLSSLVNGGNLPTPHMVAATEDPDTKEKKSLTFPTQKVPVTESALATVREGMRLTVNSETGSARALRSLPFSSGGKTGTAQFGSTDGKTHSWYMGYAPHDNPEIVVVVIVEGGGEGNVISVPVAGRVFQYYMNNK